MSQRQKPLQLAISLAFLVLCIYGLASLPKAAGDAVNSQGGTVGENPDGQQHSTTQQSFNGTTGVNSDNTFVIHSPTFTPPGGAGGMSFKAFANRLYYTQKPTYVNASSDLVHGIITNRVLDTSGNIQVDYVCVNPTSSNFTTPDPVTAAIFKPWAEGNLKNTAIGGGSYWAANINPQYSKQLIVTTDTLCVLRHSPTIDATAVALGADGTAQSGVVVNFVVTRDQGGDFPGPGGNPQQTATTAEPIINPVNLPATATISGWSLPVAAAPATKYIVTVSADGYTPDSVSIQILDGQWVERTPLTGFDPLPPIQNPSNPPYLVVGNGVKSTASTLQLDSGVGAGVAVDTDKHATATIAPTSTDASINTDVTGVAAGSTVATAKTTPNTVATMNIAVKNQKTVQVTFFYLNDPTHAHVGTLVDQASKFTTAHDTWLNQTDVLLRQPNDPAVIDVSAQNFGDHPNLQTILTFVGGRPAPGPNKIFVYVCWDIAFTGNEEAVTSGAICYVKTSITAHDLAHEIGHALGIRGDGVQGDYTIQLRGRSEDLMAWFGGDNALRVHKYQADIVNP